MKRSMIMGLLCAPVGLLSTILILFYNADYQMFVIYSPVAAFGTATIIW